MVLPPGGRPVQRDVENEAAFRMIGPTRRKGCLVSDGIDTICSKSFGLELYRARGGTQLHARVHATRMWGSLDIGMIIPRNDVQVVHVRA